MAILIFIYTYNHPRGLTFRMNAPENFTPQPIMVSDNAVNKVRNLLEEEGNVDLKLRVFVTGGGCSGFQYGFTFDELVADDDAVITKDDVTVLVDSMSYAYLVGAQIDYKQNLEGSKFLVENPNADTTCGCGSSFSI
jgi:iron-sulfur cluster insertion protein